MQGVLSYLWDLEEQRGVREVVKSSFWEGGCGRDKPQSGDQFGVDISIHHEGCSHYVILLFWNFIEVLPAIFKVILEYNFLLNYCCFIPIVIKEIISLLMSVTEICNTVSSFWDNISNLI